jgi:hypothetical protein
VFVAEIDADPACGGDTEIYIPAVQFPRGYSLRLEGAAAKGATIRCSGQVATIAHAAPGACRIVVAGAGAAVAATSAPGDDLDLAPVRI